MPRRHPRLSYLIERNALTPHPQNSKCPGRFRPGHPLYSLNPAFCLFYALIGEFALFASGLESSPFRRRHSPRMTMHQTIIMAMPIMIVVVPMVVELVRLR